MVRNRECVHQTGLSIVICLIQVPYKIRRCDHRNRGTFEMLGVSCDDAGHGFPDCTSYQHCVFKIIVVKSHCRPAVSNTGILKFWKYSRSMPIGEAVDLSVRECISEGGT